MGGEVEVQEEEEEGLVEKELPDRPSSTMHAVVRNMAMAAPAVVVEELPCPPSSTMHDVIRSMAMATVEGRALAPASLQRALLLTPAVAAAMTPVLGVSLLLAGRGRMPMLLIQEVCMVLSAIIKTEKKCRLL